MALTLIFIYVVGVFLVYGTMFSKVKNELVEYKGRWATRGEKQKGCAQAAIFWPIVIPVSVVYAVVIIFIKAVK